MPDDNASDDFDRPRGILSPTDRRWISGITEYENQPTEVRRRDAAHERIRNAILDFSLLTQNSERIEHDRIYPRDREDLVPLLEAGADVIGFILRHQVIELDRGGSAMGQKSEEIIKGYLNSLIEEALTEAGLGQYRVTLDLSVIDPPKSETEGNSVVYKDEVRDPGKAALSANKDSENIEKYLETGDEAADLLLRAYSDIPVVPQDEIDEE